MAHSLLPGFRQDLIYEKLRLYEFARFCPIPRRQRYRLFPVATAEKQTHFLFDPPLLVMATVTEFVILATGWKYQQVVCLPKGMGVTFFGIGPIGATILAVELLKLPLAIWTASRQGWQKGLMLVIGFAADLLADVPIGQGHGGL